MAVHPPGLRLCRLYISVSAGCQILYQSITHDARSQEYSAYISGILAQDACNVAVRLVPGRAWYRHDMPDARASLFASPPVAVLLL